MRLLGDALAQGPLYWLTVLLEVASVIAAILLIGLVAGMTSFWILGRFARKLAGPSAELDAELETDSDEPGEEMCEPVDSGKPPGSGS